MTPTDASAVGRRQSAIGGQGPADSPQPTQEEHGLGGKPCGIARCF